MNPALEDLNEEQYQAATCLDNVVVAAGAGSGKTHVLSHRYAWLVTEKKYTPDQILTLTFTKKAAAEMYSRIYKTLKEMAETQTGELQSLAQNAVNSFHKARIQTLDSYCNTVVKTAIHHYGISPDFTMDDMQSDILAHQMALPFVLNRLHLPAMKALVRDQNPEKAAAEFFAEAVRKHSNLATPTCFTAMADQQRIIAREEWKKLTPVVTELMLKIKGVIDECQLKREFTPAAQETYKKAFEEHGALLTSEAPAIDDTAAALKWLGALNSIKIIRGGLVAKTAQVFIKGEYDPPYILREPFTSLCQLYNFEISFEQNRAVCQLLDEYQTEYHEACRSSGILTFADVSEFARRILIDYPEIRNQEKKSFKAIMIDEFQDDNQLQRDILYLISEKVTLSGEGVPTADQLTSDKLFFVGDEKQSIYKFRGADVTVFNALKTELNNSRQLKTNYRSKENLLKAFNDIFSPADCAEAALFETKPAPADAGYEAHYTDAEIAEKNLEKSADADKKRVHIQLIHDEANPDGTLLSAHLQQARMTADHIKSLMAAEGYHYSDFAILFRWTTHQKEFERVLRENGIPYAAENVSGFFDEGVINDLYSFLRLLVYPSDTFAYGNVLRSPLVQLSSKGTMKLLRYISEKKTITLPFSAEQETLLGESDKEQFQKGKSLFENLQEQSKTATVAELITCLWYTAGYRYETMWNSTVSVYDTLFDYLYETARRYDAENGSLAAYVDYLAEIKSDNKQKLDDIDIPMEQRDAVHIMTIHKSKGLEFPVVFIPDLDNSFNPLAEGNTFYSYTRQFGLVPKSAAVEGLCDYADGNWFTTQNTQIESLLAVAELRRILYVGITRAEDEIFLIGRDKKNTRGLTQEELKGAPVTYSSMLKLLTTNMLEFTRPEAVLVTSDEAASVQNQVTRYITTENAPFTFESFARIPLEMTESLNGDDSTRRKFSSIPEAIASSRDQYDSPAEIDRQLANDRSLEPIRAKPSSFGTTAGVNESAADVSEKQLFNTTKLEDLLKKSKDTESEAFAENDFGTMAHAAAEHIFTNTFVPVPKNIAAKLTETQLADMQSLAKEMAEYFTGTELGQKALQAPLCKSEYTFKTRFHNADAVPVLVDGQIDLLFDCPDDNILYVIDFKSDRVINPEHHLPQLAFYKRAAEQMFATTKTGRQVRCYLYYLRYGKTVDCTEAASDITLENLTASSN